MSDSRTTEEAADSETEQTPNIFDLCARRCPNCRGATFYGKAGDPLVKCADCGRGWKESELTEPDWKTRS